MLLAVVGHVAGKHARLRRGRKNIDATHVFAYGKAGQP
jgi:hypothetical protein